jgi:hypothetical protein
LLDKKINLLLFSIAGATTENLPPGVLYQVRSISFFKENLQSLKKQNFSAFFTQFSYQSATKSLNLY